MSSVRRIAVLVNLDAGFCRDVVSGIQAYAIEHAQWIFHREAPALKVLPPLRQWKPHGIIAQLATAEFAERVMRLHKPVVDLAYTLPNLDVPVVDADHMAVGCMAAEHFLDRGFAEFGFFGSSRAALLSAARGRVPAAFGRSGLPRVALPCRLFAPAALGLQLDEGGTPGAAMAETASQAGSGPGL